MQRTLPTLRSSLFSTSRRTFATTPFRREHFLDAKPDVFTAQIAGEKLTLVDFYADWCGPCKTLTPILKRVVTPESGVDLVTVNTDEQQDLAAKYKVASLPTVLAMRKGEVLAKFVGAQPEASVKAFIASLKQ